MKMDRNYSFNVYSHDTYMTAGLVMGNFARLINAELDRGYNIAEENATVYDRLLGGLFVLSLQVQERLRELVDFDAYFELPESGHFGYDQLDLDAGAGTLPEYLIHHLHELDALHNIAENMMLPTDEELDTLIRQWAEERGIPLAQ